ncbi:hypothetical protein TNCV_856631 [Trichonephila clavipes]|nr:hypothetical protein TNCV_856631 [Trichonephila clavipes]
MDTALCGGMMIQTLVGDRSNSLSRITVSVCSTTTRKLISMHPRGHFHSLDLAMLFAQLCYLMLNFEVANDLHNSDHFPLQVSHVNGAGTRFRPPLIIFIARRLGSIHTVSDYLRHNGSELGKLMEAVFNVTEAIRNAADAAIPKTSNSPRKAVQTMVERFLPTSQREQKEGVGYFQGYLHH